MTELVHVLLSSFNGDRFISQQLDSVLRQTHPHIRIDIRDDGSRDGTDDILNRFVQDHPDVRVRRGTNIGASASFFRLLQDAEPDGAGYAFCDQDDVWLPTKIERGLHWLGQVETAEPALYCSRVHYVDAELRSIGYSWIPRRGPSFKNALVENIAVGCTSMLNGAARDLVLQYPPGEGILHDWWCYMLLSALGTVVYDPEPTIQYRLHGRNTTGAAPSFLQNVRRRAFRFARQGKYAFSAHRQALHLLRCCADRLSPDKERVLRRFVDSKHSAARRLSYAFSPDAVRQSRFDGLLIRGLYLTDHY